MSVSGFERISVVFQRLTEHHSSPIKVADQSTGAAVELRIAIDSELNKQTLQE